MDPEVNAPGSHMRPWLATRSSMRLIRRHPEGGRSRHEAPPPASVMATWKRTVAYAAFCAGVALAGLPVLRALVEHSSNDETASHLILIPFVSVVLVYLRKEAIFSSVRFDA